MFILIVNFLKCVMWKSIVGKGYGKIVLEIELDFKDVFYKYKLF